jgi:hypothetical protein
MKNLCILFAGVLLLLALWANASRKRSNDDPLATYSLKPRVDKFRRVVVVIDGCNDGDLDVTINSILNQNVQVSEIATKREKTKCDLPHCEAVLNRYNDPYKKGIIQSTFEREMEADTVVVFVKRGFRFESPSSLQQLLNAWTPGSPIETESVSVMTANQCH